MNNDIRSSISKRGNTVIAILLIGLGVLFLLKPVVNIDIGHYAWPFFVIVPGVMLLVTAFGVGDSAGEPLAMLGTVVTVAGLILLFQNLTDQWATWAYAWALVAPTSIGLGQILYGSIKGRSHLVTVGMRLVKVGLAIFIAGAVFFELIIGISGFGLGNWGWPVLLIALGVVLLVRYFLPARKSQ
jgi:uncharacterized membrane protein HdeD (DUF308 family)